MPLHVTNGDAVLYLLKKAGFSGTQIAWRDSLNDGPVPADLSLRDLSRLRATYLAERGYGSAIKLLHDFERRDAFVARASTFDEVVLWFEHDLYDQLQLVQVLVALHELALEPGKVSLVASDAYLGSMTVDEIAALYPRRRTVTGAVYMAAQRAWTALTATVPDPLCEQARIDPIGLPFLRPAIRRLCEEYPSLQNGLSRSQQQALLAVAGSPSNDESEFYRRAQAHEEAPFLVDAAFGAILGDLARPPAALIETIGDIRRATVLGRRVLGGDADWLVLGGVDRWIGGVHVRAASPYRFDAERGVFTR